MSNPYQKPIYGFRFVEILHGDTLQSIAAREVGDAAVWAQLIALNSLLPPYVTDDPSEVKDGVLLSGGVLKVPAPQPVVTTTTDPDLVFERDIQLDKYGGLTTENGDFAVAAGRANLRQALANRMITDRGELVFHQEYGSRVRSLLGAINGPTAALLAAQYAKSAILGDSRIKQVNSSVAEVAGDVIQVSVEAEPIVGRVVDVNVTL